MLWKAAEDGDFDTCLRLIEVERVDVNESHQLWTTPLTKASENGY